MGESLKNRGGDHDRHHNIYGVRIFIQQSPYTWPATCSTLLHCMNDDHTPHERLVTVNRAAELLGISVEAVRARMNRGTLPKEKAPDGTVYVRMDANQMRPDDDDANDHTVWDSPAFQLMQDQIAFLRSELERKDHLLAAALERIPALEEPSEPREEPESAPEEADKGAAPPAAERRSWWRRIFGA
jgi:hypothetical protein